MGCERNRVNDGVSLVANKIGHDYRHRIFISSRAVTSDIGIIS